MLDKRLLSIVCALSLLLTLSPSRMSRAAAARGVRAPKNTVPVSGKENVETLLKLIDALEELDDVQKVWANFDIDDADLADL